MENEPKTNDSGKQTINIQIPTVDNIAKRRPLIPFSFAIVIIFFFFNFFLVKCGGQEIGSVTGINLVTGTELKSNDMITGRETKGEEIPRNIWAIIALASAIIGLGGFLIKEKREAVIGTGVGVIGFGSLVILQFAINNAIGQKGQGQINVSFQFGYWGALFAMGVAGILSYLRMQKTHRIVVHVSPPSPNTAPVAEAVSHQQTMDPPPPLKSNFDTFAWLKKNKNIVIGVVGACILLYGVYYFFLRHDPVKDGQNAAASICDCSKQQNEQLIACYKKFIADFTSYKFSGRQEARTKLESLVQPITNLYRECYDKNQQKLEQKKGRYITDQEQMGKFEYAFNAQNGICSSNSNELNSLNTEVANKINEYVGPVEKEQAKQDSIAAAKVAEMAAQADMAFDNATKHLPSHNQMKLDLIGRNLTNANWNFAKLEEIKSFKITNETFQKNTHTYIGTVELGLQDYKNRDRFHSTAVITYTWDINSNTWSFQSIVSQEYHQVR